MGLPSYTNLASAGDVAAKAALVAVITANAGPTDEATLVFQTSLQASEIARLCGALVAAGTLKTVNNTVAGASGAYASRSESFTYDLA
jgi:hypothetical protein